jgi:hypothetical protein
MQQPTKASGDVNEAELEMSHTYLGLGASATVGVNPNVFSLNATTLVEVHVLEELFKSVCVFPLWL